MLPATILGSSMSFIDCSVVNVALPAMQRSFATDFGMLQWVMNGYLLALASLILLGGAAGDRHLGCGRCLHDRTRAAARRLARRYGRLAFNFLPQRADQCGRTVICAQASTGPADGPIGAHELLRRHAGNRRTRIPDVRPGLARGARPGPRCRRRSLRLTGRLDVHSARSVRDVADDAAVAVPRPKLQTLATAYVQAMAAAAVLAGFCALAATLTIHPQKRA